jgi:predicted ArsR family transcriptional regulator
LTFSNNFLNGNRNLPYQTYIPNCVKGKQHTATAYFANAILLEEGWFSATEIADEAGIHRSAAYDNLDSMVQLGTLEADYESTPQRYRLNEGDSE